MLQYIGPLLAVGDITVARRFYEDCLGQIVKDDFGVNVSFEGNFAIHQQVHLQDLLGAQPRYAITRRANAEELVFETDEIDALSQRLQQAGVEFIHATREQPWGQRVMRVYDPDGHILEIGETMAGVVVRLHQQGMTVEDICQRTAMSRAFVEGAIREPPA